MLRIQGSGFMMSPVLCGARSSYKVSGHCLVCTLHGLLTAKCASPWTQHSALCSLSPHQLTSLHPNSPVSSQVWPHQTAHPLPFCVPLLPRFILLEIPVLQPSKLLLIFKSHFCHCLLQEALPPQLEGIAPFFLLVPLLTLSSRGC